MQLDLSQVLIFIGLLDDLASIMSATGAHAVGKHRFKAVGAFNHIQFFPVIV